MSADNRTSVKLLRAATGPYAIALAAVGGLAYAAWVLERECRRLERFTMPTPPPLFGPAPLVPSRHCARCRVEWEMNGPPAQCPNCGQRTSPGWLA